MGVFIPIVAILASAWVVVTFMHYRMGRRRTRGANDGASIADARENARLARDNEMLRLSVQRLEERLAVLERIATDPAERTAREIEALR